MHSHLVTVEVGIESRTCQRVQLDCLTLNHLGLERLDTQTVKCRGTVQKHRMTFHHILKDIPYNRFLAVNNLLGRFNSLHNAAFNQFADYKRLVKLCCHIFRNTALVHLQLGAYNDNRAG